MSLIIQSNEDASSILPGSVSARFFDDEEEGNILHASSVPCAYPLTILFSSPLASCAGPLPLYSSPPASCAGALIFYYSPGSSGLPSSSSPTPRFARGFLYFSFLPRQLRRGLFYMYLSWVAGVREGRKDNKGKPERRKKRIK